MTAAAPSPVSIARALAAIDVLRECDTYEEARSRLASECDEDSASGLRAVFARAGMRAPSAYLRGATKARGERPSEDAANDDGPASAPRRDTDPAPPGGEDLRPSTLPISEPPVYSGAPPPSYDDPDDDDIDTVVRRVVRGGVVETPCRQHIDCAPPLAPSELHRLLICPDLHAPNHCPKAWGLFLRAGRQLKPHTIVIMGDFADFFSVSSHDKNPSRKSSLAAELEVVKECLDEILALGASRVIYISGNHESRYSRYLQTKAPELWGMQTLPDILGLPERGIEWVPYMRSIKIGAVTFTHDVGEAGIYAIKRARDAAEGNIVLGHLHAMGTHYSGTATGHVKVGACFGWLGKVEDAGDYMHLLKANRNWTHGFGVGMMEENGTMHLQAVPIIDGRCVVNGVLVQ